MTDKASLKEKVKRANREYHDELTVEDYEDNPSIFDATRQAEIRSMLERIARPEGSFLDIGCGTGNVLQLADEYFRDVYGVDISLNMLGQARENAPGSSLFLGDAERLPFEDNTFDVVSYYAALHHFPEPIDFLREGARVLRKGGVLYTDHDPNYFLVRFYYPLFRLYHLGRTGFGSEEGDLAEYFHTQEPGMNPEPLAQALRDWGFQEVNVQYRQTRNKDLSAVKKLVFSVLKPLSDWTEWRSLFTHFTIQARK